MSHAYTLIVKTDAAAYIPCASFRIHYGDRTDSTNLIRIVQAV
jgi:hypothetical protein